MAPALFLDRDGVVNIDRGYVFEWDNFEWVEGVDRLISKAREEGLRVVIVTNQSGIGRGYYTEEDFLKLTDMMLARILVDAVVYCPHSPEEACPGRKPGTKMLELVSEVLAIQPEGSWLIGDKESDMEAAMRFGLHPCKFTGGDLYQFAKDNRILT